MTEITNPPQFDHAAIAKQNDAFRRHVCLGSPWPDDMPPLDGQLVCTAAIAARGGALH